MSGFVYRGLAFICNTGFREKPEGRFLIERRQTNLLTQPPLCMLAPSRMRRLKIVATPYDKEGWERRGRKPVNQGPDQKVSKHRSENFVVVQHYQESRNTFDPPLRELEPISTLVAYDGGSEVGKKGICGKVEKVPFHAVSAVLSENITYRSRKCSRLT